MSGKHDFWLACGHHLLDRDAAGRLLVTDEFLKVYLARAELVPPPEACPAERRLHDILLGNPRQAVTSSQIAAIADPDARENWEMMIAWRNHLVRHGTLESAYLEIVRRNIRLPQVFVGQLIQVILRNALDDCTDAFVLRAAEMFFRPQKLTVEGNSIIAWDEEAAASVSDRRHQSPLFALLGLPAAVEADVLTDRHGRQLLAAQRPLRHRARSDGRTTRIGGVGPGDRALDIAFACGGRRGRAAGGTARRAAVVVCRAERRRDADRRRDLEWK